MINKKHSQSIGIFDSGFGGLTILRGIIRLLPQYDYVYLADTARAPYGALSSATVYRYTKQAIDFLFGNNCRLVILACNTASCEALRRIQQEYLPATGWPDKKVLGVLVPAAETAARTTRSGIIGLIATKRTVESGAFIREIKKGGPIRIFQSACPGLVPLIEAGEHDSEKMEKLLKVYLAPLLKKRIDTLVLGCTHYDIIRDKIEKIAGPEIKIVSEAECVPGKLKNYLARHQEIKKDLKKGPSVRYFTTGPLRRFEKLGSTFSGQTIKANKVNLENT